MVSFWVLITAAFLFFPKGPLSSWQLCLVFLRMVRVDLLCAKNTQQTPEDEPAQLLFLRVMFQRGCSHANYTGHKDRVCFWHVAFESMSLLFLLFLSGSHGLAILFWVALAKHNKHEIIHITKQQPKIGHHERPAFVLCSICTCVCPPSD